MNVNTCRTRQKTSSPSQLARLSAVGFVLCGLLSILFGFSTLGYAQDLSTRVLTALEDKRPKIRIVAVAAVAHSKDKNARRILEGMLGDKSPQVRASAAQGLAHHGSEKTIRLILLLLKEEKKPLVLSELQKTLGLLQKATAPAPAVKKDTPAVRVFLFPVDDFSKSAKPALRHQLLSGVKTAILANKRRSWVFASTEKEKGYGLMLRIRSITPGKQEKLSLVDVKCEMTLVSTPSKALRLASTASAAVGIEGDMSEEIKWELVSDAIDACAPALVEDFLGYALSR